MRLFIYVVLFFLLFSASNAHAHLRGVPILKINGIDARVYPAQSLRADVFDLPFDSDAAPENYLVHQELTFEIDTTKLPPQPEVFEKTNFIWDFGDETEKETIQNGNTNTHAYTKPGTYVMTVHADYAPAGYPEIGTQQVQAVVLNILPREDYVLPQAAILIDNTLMKNNKHAMPLGDSHTFEASTILAPSGKIISYEWDFDDGRVKNTKSANHAYELPQYSAVVMLRITDENGFFSDTAISLTNNGSNKPSTFGSAPIAVAAGLVAITGAILLFVHKRKKKG